MRTHHLVVISHIEKEAVNNKGKVVHSFYLYIEEKEEGCDFGQAEKSPGQNKKMNQESSNSCSATH